MGFKDVQSYLPHTIDVACHNSSTSCTISGPKDDVLQVINSLKENKIFVKAVNTGERSFHSRYIIPIADNLRQLLKEVSQFFAFTTDIFKHYLSMKYLIQFT